MQRVLHFFLTKMLIGVGIIVSLVVAVESSRHFGLDKTNLPDDVKAFITAVAEASIVTVGYISLFRIFDKRRIDELKAEKFIANAVTGSLIGITLQGLFILVIYFGGSYVVMNENPVSTLVNPFAFALTAGFVAEILIIGIVFRLLEEQTGTVIALLIFIVLFAILHINVKGATVISISATALQAGLVLPAAFIYSRNLWLPIFLHFGWDFAEPGLFGGINPSSSLTQGLLTSKISGPTALTGGETGPQDSLTSVLFSLLLGITFLILAQQKKTLLKSRWQATAINNYTASSEAGNRTDQQL